MCFFGLLSVAVSGSITGCWKAHEESRVCVRTTQRRRVSRLVSKMPHCCVPGCRSHSRLRVPGVTFHKFPIEEKQRRMWADVVRCDRQKWEPGRNSRVCSKHFLPQDFDRSSPLRVRLQKGAFPTLSTPRSVQQTLADPGAGGHGYCFVPTGTLCTVSETSQQSPSPSAMVSWSEEDSEPGLSGPLEVSMPPEDVQESPLKQSLEKLLNRLKRQSSQSTPSAMTTPKRRKQVIVSISSQGKCPRDEIQLYRCSLSFFSQGFERIFIMGVPV